MILNRHYLLFCFFLLVSICLPLFLLANTSAANEEPARTRTGLQALYDFSSGDGDIVKDRSEIGQPLDLIIEDEDQVHRTKGSLEVRGETLIRSEAPPTKIIKSVQWTGEITIEAWIRPAFTTLEGPARIVTFSKNSSQRNFTLGQDGDQYDFRLRTTATSGNGIPSIHSDDEPFSTELTHVVYTRDRDGRARLYINGNLVEEDTISGSTMNWDASHTLALANEIGKGRPWLGTYYLIAIYNRDLLPNEVEAHFNAGHNPKIEYEQLASGSDFSTHPFETEIAPIIMARCIECHDASTKKGGLDLSTKTMAFTGGNNGSPIVPGKPQESMFWTMVDQGVMPLGRTPLPKQEKNAIKEWIANGAEWTMETLEPATLAHGSSTQDIWIQRLTVPEYIEAVRSLVGVDIAKEAHELLPKDLRADGFSNTAYNLNIDLKHVEAYSKLAEIIVSKMDVIEFASTYSNSKRLTDDNMRGLIAKMGKFLLRGPLEEYEINIYRGISTTAASAGKDFKDAVRFVLEAMLQSPRFIYRIENQRGDGGLWPIGEYELASRLSYILWGAPPDDELMRAAEAGELYTREGVKAQVNRMMYDRRTVKRSQQFIAEWLNLNRLENLRPNKDKFPEWKPEIADDMRDETIAFFTDIVWKQNRPLTDLLDAQVTYVTARLAEHYGMEPKQDGLTRYDLKPVPSRGGLLTQGSILTVGGDEASMVTRGLFVLHDLLRGSVSDPPPCVDTTPVPTKPGLTNRGIAEQRIANPQCGGCHSKFEPLAFGLEKFDGLGTYHEADEHGNELRDDGEVVFPASGDVVEYDTAEELMRILAGSGRVAETITWKLAQFSLGRPLSNEDTPILKEVHQTAQDQGGTYIDTITAIVMSDLVQKIKTEAYN